MHRRMRRLWNVFIAKAGWSEGPPHSVWIEMVIMCPGISFLRGFELNAESPTSSRKKLN